MTVLVIGATGSIGSRVVEELLAHGEDVRGVVRNASRTKGFPDKADAFIADLNDAEAVTFAVEGVERIVLIAANTANQAQQEANVIESARLNDVQHLVKLSVGGAAPDAGLALARAHWTAEVKLRESGVPFTTVRPGFFMQNLLQYSSWIAEDGTWPLPMGDQPIAMVHAADVAKIIATVVVSNPFGSDVNVTGGTALTMAEAADALGHAAGRPISYVDGDPSQFFDRMVALGADEQYARDMTVLYDEIIRAGYAGAVSDDVQTILHRAPITFAQFAEENAVYFQ